ncbi:MAG: hypothetical protein CW346_12975 [Bacillaceae bacterium]|nr:hypothetical protein [Bacillaceae bacterium]
MFYDHHAKNRGANLPSFLFFKRLFDRAPHRSGFGLFAVILGHVAGFVKHEVLYREAGIGTK